MDEIMVTHAGSLVRPPGLVEILRDKERGAPCSEEAYEQALRQSVSEVVRQQVDAGVDIVSDGEFGKSVSWSRYIRERLAGFETRPDDASTPDVIAEGDKRRFPDFYEEYEKTHGFTGTLGNWVCTGAVRYAGHAVLRRDIANLKAAAESAGAVGAFLPVVAPASVVPWHNNEYYDSEEDYVFAVADALNAEYRTIVDSGLLLQVDDAFLTMKYDYMAAQGTQAAYRPWAELRIEALIRALHGIPADRVRYHVCWGSWNGPHTGDVPLKEIIDLVLRVPVGGYMIEQANPRHEHEWRIWEKVRLPEGRALIPGLVSHATNIVEHPELVAERLTRLARLVGKENVIASTDCGFAQGPFVRRVHPTIMWAKLRSLADGARLATRQLRNNH